MSNAHINERHVSPWLTAANVSKWRFVEQATDASQVQHAQADSVKVVGITKKATSSGESADVIDDGVCLLEVNAASPNIAVGDVIKSAASGIGVQAGAGDVGFAIAREAATADGAVIHVLFAPHTEIDS